MNGRPSGPRHGTRCAIHGVVQLRRRGTDFLAEEREAGGGAVRVAQDLEDGERPPQQRLEAGLRFDHDELSRERGRGHLRRIECDHVVVGRQPAVVANRRVDIDGHPIEYINRTRSKGPTVQEVQGSTGRSVSRSKRLDPPTPTDQPLEPSEPFEPGPLTWRTMIRAVRYLRILLNAVVAGGLMAGYLATLFLQLNPQCRSTRPRRFRSWQRCCCRTACTPRCSFTASSWSGSCLERTCSRRGG